MSLLNQVLQDLEKRNAENLPEQLKLSNLKAITIKPSRSYYLPFAILCITGIIAIIIFTAQKTPGTLEKPDIAKQSIVKQSVAIQTSANVIKKIPPKQPSVPEPVHSINSPISYGMLDSLLNSLWGKMYTDNTFGTINIYKAQASKTIQTSSQQIGSGYSARQKKQPAKIKAKRKTIRKKPKDQTIKKPSNKQKAEHYFLLAEKQQHHSDKQKNLELAILLNPQHINARLLLTNTLLQQGLTIQSAKLLDQSLVLFPQNLQFITLRSQLFLQQKQAQDALNILHLIDENYVQDETYLSLLAAAYQQNNDNFNSLKTYQKLLNINPQKAEYWLGLAIALEKQGYPQQARNAYQQALDKNTLKPVILSYIKQRISILK